MKRILGIILATLLTVGIFGFMIATASVEVFLMSIGVGALATFLIILVVWLLSE
jgi:hypothetical protein